MKCSKKQIREKFSRECGHRDKYRCAVPTCKSMICDHYDTHHITNRNLMPNSGYTKSNGITLCYDCHWKAEKFHRTEGKEWEEGFHPDDLYKIIGSSYEKAREDSERLQ